MLSLTVFLKPQGLVTFLQLAEIEQWRYRSANSGKNQHDMRALHEKYGPIVRTGPTTISISDPSYIPRIYGIGQGFHKVCSHQN